MSNLCTDKDLSKYFPTQCIIFHYFLYNYLTKKVDSFLR